MKRRRNKKIQGLGLGLFWSYQNNNIILQNWAQGLGLVFQVDTFFFFFNALRPNHNHSMTDSIWFIFQPWLLVRLISTIVPIGMLDLSSTLALTLSVKWALCWFFTSIGHFLGSKRNHQGLVMVPKHFKRPNLVSFRFFF
jgi:hypothetical protein